MSLWVPCHPGAVLGGLRERGTRDELGVTPVEPFQAAELGGSTGLARAGSPVTTVPPVLGSPGSGLAEHLLLPLWGHCWGSWCRGW